MPPPESAEPRPGETILQAAMGGLFAALAGRRTVAVHLKGLPNDQAQEEAAAVLQTLPQELRTAPPVEGDVPLRPTRLACARLARRRSER
jgi:hypothetical protein